MQREAREYRFDRVGEGASGLHAVFAFVYEQKGP
jgi:hypothetical protein